MGRALKLPKTSSPVEKAESIYNFMLTLVPEASLADLRSRIRANELAGLSKDEESIVELIMQLSKFEAEHCNRQ
jgi:hypothetical protein